MNIIFKEYLFTNSILVSEEVSENAFEVRFLLANQFNISITKGQEYAHENIIPFVAEMLGEDVPEAFYKGFPNSVRELTRDQLLFDQLSHYYITYGCNNFTRAGHSLFEESFERLAFKEDVEIKKFVILDEVEAIEKLKEYIEDILKDTRPLNISQYNFVKTFIKEFNYDIKNCSCKDTVINLLLDSKDINYAKFLALSDVIKLVDALNYKVYHNENIKKLNFCNQDRKFITRVIRKIFELGNCNIKDCFLA